MHHICHVTWDCILCNVKCIVTRSLNLKWSLTCEIVQELPQQHSPLSDCDWSSNSSICNSCSSSDWNHPFISSFAFSICKTCFFLQNVTIFRFLFVFYTFSRQVVSNIFERRTPLFVFNDSLKPFVILIRKMKFLSKFLPGFFYLGIWLIAQSLTVLWRRIWIQILTF